jgi:hypothetical protein
MEKSNYKVVDFIKLLGGELDSTLPGKLNNLFDLNFFGKNLNCELELVTYRGSVVWEINTCSSWF